MKIYNRDVLRPFSKELIDSKICNTIKNIMLTYPTTIESILLESFKVIWCDPDIPENHNIQVTSLTGKYLRYYNKSWNNNARMCCSVKQTVYDKLLNILYTYLTRCIIIFSQELPFYLRHSFVLQYTKLTECYVSKKQQLKLFNDALYEHYIYLANAKRAYKFKN